MAGMNPQMMEAAQKMMSKMSQEDMDRMMQVLLLAPRACRNVTNPFFGVCVADDQEYGPGDDAAGAADDV